MTDAQQRIAKATAGLIAATNELGDAIASAAVAGELQFDARHALLFRDHPAVLEAVSLQLSKAGRPLSGWRTLASN
jgi:hypothetical protein